MVDAITEADRPCTKQDIADRTGVSRPTIINHEGELEQDPRVESGKVGSATAYWLSSEEQPSSQGQVRADGGFVQIDDHRGRLHGHIGSFRVENAPKKWLTRNLGLILIFFILSQAFFIGGLIVGESRFFFISALWTALALLGAFAELMLLLGYRWPWEQIGAFGKRVFGGEP